MVRYLFQRFLALIPTVLVTCFITFMLGYYGPGDPVRTLMGGNWANEEQYMIIKHDLGMDRPILVQFAYYVIDAVQGDFGVSWLQNRPVNDLIKQTLPITIQLAAAAIVVVILCAIPLGIVAALKQNTWIDRLIVSSSVLLYAIPPYVLIPVLLVLLVLELDILPVGVGWSGLFRLEMVIPVVVLALGPLVFIVRQVRGGILEVLEEDYVRTAEAKGMPQRIIIFRHVLPNALTPALSQIGLAFAFLLISSIFVEDIFGIPGFGALIISALYSRDYVLLMGTVIVSVFLVAVVNLMTDILYGVLDPRVRLG